jgi:photosystem II stability/assembly factor-like uncharacterized protein
MPKNEEVKNNIYSRLTILLLLLCLIYFNKILSQQLYIDKIDTVSLVSISFSDSLNGWIAGSSVVYQTTDGGIKWNLNPISKYNRSFSSVSSPSPNNTWLVWKDSNASYVTKTNNSGITWDTVLHSVFSSENSIFYSQVQALDSLHVWLTLGGEPLANFVLVCHTIDGGVNWTGPMGISWLYRNEFNSLSAVNDAVIGVVFGWSDVITTFDGGSSWRGYRLKGSINDLVLTSANNLWAVGDSGRIYKSSDGNAHWSLQQSNTLVNLHSIAAHDSLIAWTVGARGTILNTTNSGFSWNSIAIHLEMDLRAIEFISPNRALIVGDSGIVIRLNIQTPNKAIAFHYTNMSFTLGQNCPNPFNSTTLINYRLARKSAIELVITDLLGREVLRLTKGIKNPGEYCEKWDATGLSSGLYFCKLKADYEIKAIKMILAK